jgi:hypothetical protein
MFAYPALPKRRRPSFHARELHLHAHRSRAGITADERDLVVVLLTRYVFWCAKARRFDRMRDALGLLLEISPIATYRNPRM